MSKQPLVIPPRSPIGLIKTLGNLYREVAPWIDANRQMEEARREQERLDQERKDEESRRTRWDEERRRGEGTP